jgi:hypothetical protein
VAGLEKAVITNLVTGEEISVLFNPEEYTVSKDNNFASLAVPGLRSPLLQFVHGNLRTLAMELLVDSYERHQSGTQAPVAAGSDVRALTRRITGLLDIDPGTHAPPLLLFAWGSLAFRCVLAKVSEKFVMFLPSGVPVRARLEVTFNEFTNADFEAKETKRQTADYSRVHVVAEGETLSGIAGHVYRNPELWRPIALRNALAEPRVLEVGRILQIPQIPFRDPETGEVMR